MMNTLPRSTRFNQYLVMKYTVMSREGVLKKRSADKF